MATFVGELPASLLLSVDMCKTDIVDAKFEVFSVLHDCDGILEHVESVIEGAFKLLSFLNHDAVSEHPSLPTHLR